MKQEFYGKILEYQTPEWKGTRLRVYKEAEKLAECMAAYITKSLISAIRKVK
jgi:hypothetical protein